MLWIFVRIGLLGSDRWVYCEFLLFPGIISLIIIGFLEFRVSGFSAGVLRYVGDQISSDAAPRTPIHTAATTSFVQAVQSDFIRPVC
jgi:hypothetical protein